jgi:hypothetical protein
MESATVQIAWVDTGEELQSSPSNSRIAYRLYLLVLREVTLDVALRTFRDRPIVRLRKMMVASNDTPNRQVL